MDFFILEPGKTKDAKMARLKMGDSLKFQKFNFTFAAHFTQLIGTLSRFRHIAVS